MKKILIGLFALGMISSAYAEKNPCVRPAIDAVSKSFDAEASLADEDYAKTPKGSGTYYLYFQIEQCWFTAKIKMKQTSNTTCKRVGKPTLDESNTNCG